MISVLGIPHTLLKQIQTNRFYSALCCFSHHGFFQILIFHQTRQLQSRGHQSLVHGMAPDHGLSGTGPCKPEKSHLRTHRIQAVHETMPSSPHPKSAEKLPSTELILGTRKVEGHCYREYFKYLESPHAIFISLQIFHFPLSQMLPFFPLTHISPDSCYIRFMLIQ